MDGSEERKIGPDAIRFKHIKEISDHSVIVNVEGTICNVGLDFVDLLHNHCIVHNIKSI
jgi:hypothetical protein